MKPLASHPILKNHYQFQLAQSLTGKEPRTIAMYMRRHNLSLSEAIIYYLKKQGIVSVEDFFSD